MDLKDPKQDILIVCTPFFNQEELKYLQIAVMALQLDVRKYKDKALNEFLYKLHQKIMSVSSERYYQYVVSIDKKMLDKLTKYMKDKNKDYTKAYALEDTVEHLLNVALKKEQEKPKAPNCVDVDKLKFE